MFYLGESCRFTGQLEKAIEWYNKRIVMGGWPEEIFWSMLQVGLLKKELGYPQDEVIQDLTHTHQFRPHRIEPVYYLAELYMQVGRHDLAYVCIKSRELLAPSPQKDVLFNMDWMQTYGLLFQLSICSYYVGQYQESINACNTLLTIKDLPKNIRAQTEKNRHFAIQKLTR